MSIHLSIAMKDMSVECSKDCGEDFASIYKISLISLGKLNFNSQRYSKYLLQENHSY